MKIVLIGAGSRSFGRGTIVDVLAAPEFRGRGVTLSLVDLDATALDVMLRLAGRIKAQIGSDVALEAHTDHTRALAGADFVITSVARRRMPLWEQDFRVPAAYGFRHCLGENGGPGALFHALRSLEVMIPICRDIERLCPNAFLLNYTNPEARVLHAILHLTRVKAAGFCHGVFSALRRIEHYTGRPIAEFDVTSAGMNHLYFILKCVDRRSGADLLPSLVGRAAAETDPHLPLFREFARIFDVFTFPSDDHIGEYLAFGHEFMGRKWKYGQESRPVAPPETARLADLAAYADGTKALDSGMLAPSGELVAPVIADIAFDRRNRRAAVNVLNREGYIANLPTGAAVELPAVVAADGLHPEFVGAVPESVVPYLRTQAAIIELVTEAYATRNRKLLLRALLLDPCVNSIRGAEALLDDMLRLQAEYLPSFA